MEYPLIVDYHLQDEFLFMNDENPVDKEEAVSFQLDKEGNLIRYEHFYNYIYKEIDKVVPEVYIVEFISE